MCDLLGLKDVKVKSGDLLLKLGKDGEWQHFAKGKVSDGVKGLAEYLDRSKHSVVNLVDFGGVAEHLFGGRGHQDYVKEVPKLSELLAPAYLYSFVPTNRLSSLPEMVRVCEAAGFEGLVVLTKKTGSTGKSNVAHQLNVASSSSFVYYEDTASVLDQLRNLENEAKLEESGMVKKVWVQPAEDSEFHNQATQPATGATTLGCAEFARLGKMECQKEEDSQESDK